MALSNHGEAHKKDNKVDFSRVYDRCVTDSIVKAGVGLGAGLLLSVVFFRRKYWPAVFGTGMGLGAAYADCQDAMNHPDKVQAYRFRSKEIRQLQNLKLKTLSHEAQQQKESTPPASPPGIQQVEATYTSPQAAPAPAYTPEQQAQQQYWQQQYQQATPAYQQQPFTPSPIDPVVLQRQYEFYSAHQQYYQNQGYDQQVPQAADGGYEQYNYPAQ